MLFLHGCGDGAGSVDDDDGIVMRSTGEQASCRRELGCAWRDGYAAQAHRELKMMCRSQTEREQRWDRVRDDKAWSALGSARDEDLPKPERMIMHEPANSGRQRCCCLFGPGQRTSLAGGEEEKVEEVNEGFGQSKKSASGWRQRASLSSIEGEAEPPWSQALSLPGVLRSASLSRLKSTQTL